LSMATVPPSPPPFPSTTLFRPLWSHRPAHGACARRARLGVPEGGSDLRGASVRSVPPHRRREGAAGEQGGRLHRAALPLGVDHALPGADRQPARGAAPRGAPSRLNDGALRPTVLPRGPRSGHRKTGEASHVTCSSVRSSEVLRDKKPRKTCWIAIMQQVRALPLEQSNVAFTGSLRDSRVGASPVSSPESGRGVAS